MRTHRYLAPGLIKFVAQNFQLPLMGVHGPSHWMRVLKNGLELAHMTGANTNVVELFALFHDSCRVSDDKDDGHGPRAAEFAQQCFDEGRFNCTVEELSILKRACQGHTGGTEPHNVTVATCWDADRLDLPRVYVTVNPKLLCTDSARDPAIIKTATNRAQKWLLNRNKISLSSLDDWALSKPRKA